jgi:uncharacterized cysteine cluster protein YcgN (CxxCxxCC family)
MGWLDPGGIQSLDSLSQSEWDLLCDGCGICCLYKVRTPPEMKAQLTRVACRYLDLESCTCTIYAQRHDLMPTCIDLHAKDIRPLNWLPETCAYRRITEGKPLPWWHVLRSGKHDLVHKLGISVRDIAIHENVIDLNDLQKYVIQPW